MPLVCGTGSETISTVESLQYLAIILDSRLTFRHHLSTIEKKARGRTHKLRSAVGTTWGMSPEIITLKKESSSP